MSAMSQDFLARGKEVLAAQPFSKFVGARLLRLSAENVELGLAIKPEHMQQYDFVHGGVLAYLADNALTFAGGIVLGHGVVTAEMKINYIKPAIGSELIARASPVSKGRTMVVARCDIYVTNNGVEKLCAVAQGTITPIGEKAPVE